MYMVICKQNVGTVPLSTLIKVHISVILNLVADKVKQAAHNLYYKSSLTGAFMALLCCEIAILLLCKAVWSSGLFFKVSRGIYTVYDCVHCNTQLLVFRFSFLYIT